MVENTKKIELSSDNIKDTIKRLRELRKEIQKIPENMDEIMNDAVNFCVQQTGNFAPHCNTYYIRTSKGYRIIQEGRGVVFVEFGTGVVGENAEHNPMQSRFGFVHNVGETIKELPDGRVGWFFPKDDGSWRFTQGQPARMQMYRTGEYLKERLDKEIKYKVGEAVKKW